jgi:hypothetical protein
MELQMDTKVSCTFTIEICMKKGRRVENFFPSAACGRINQVT